MRRILLLVAATALTALVVSGVALAVTRIGTDGPDTLRGTIGDDNLLGESGNHIFFALRGQDYLLGGPGKEVVAGGNRARLWEAIRTCWEVPVTMEFSAAMARTTW